MEFAVDVIHDVMRRISPSPPVMFQRDGYIHVASAAGLGLITLGVTTTPDYHDEWENFQCRQVPSEEFLASQDAIQSRSEKPWEKPIINFVRGEGKYFAPLLFGPDDNSFSLEDIVKISETLGKIPDDGKIRMVGHSSGYHSHKYGYACDGIDVWLDSARVMDREKYLEMVRAKEKQILEGFQTMVKRENMGGGRLGSPEYANFKVPDAVIITPHLMAMFPRHGKLESHKPNTWEPSTPLTLGSANNSREGFLLYNRPSSWDESPFTIHVVINKQDIKAQDSNTYLMQQAKLAQSLTRELGALNSVAPQIESFVRAYNDTHNAAFAENLESHRQIRRIRA
jgi:hypothetical protein